MHKTALRSSLVLLILVVSALLYGHSLWNPLVFDDKPFFTQSILHQYATSLFHFNLRWLSYASFGWTYELFGQNWFWFRVGNLALHATGCVLLFLFLQRLLNTVLPQSQDATQSYWLAFFAALIFALHPAAVYGVAYLVERSIILATLFGIASLLCYLNGLTQRKMRWYLASALLYFLAVFSKEHSIMLPGIALALTFLLRKPTLALAKELWLPFSLYLGIALLVFLRAKGVLGSPYEPFAAEMLAQMSDQQAGAPIAHAYPLSVITESYLFFKYLLLWILPYPGWMSVDLRQTFATQFLVWPQTAGFVLFIAYAALATRLLLQGGRRGLLGFGLLFPWILYLTELSAVRIQEPFVLYRSYLWMSGSPILLLALSGITPKKILNPALAVLCLLLAALAWNRLDTFSSNMKLWADAVAKNQDEKLPGVARAYNNRGTAHLEAGDLKMAQADFSKAFSLNPKYPEANLNIGIIHFRQKNFAEALQYYNQAIALRSSLNEAYMNRGVLLLEMGRYAEAMTDFEALIQRDPARADSYLNRATAYSRIGKPQAALSDLDEALRLDPTLVSAYVNRSALDAMQGHAESALADLDKAEHIAPDNANVYYNRGIIHGMMGRLPDAMRDYNQALALDPGYTDAYVNRGGLYMATQHLPEALADFERALKLNPNQENAYVNRGNVFATQGRFQEALADYDKALQLNAKNGQALLNRGFVLLSLNKKPEALASFRASCATGNRNACDKIH